MIACDLMRNCSCIFNIKDNILTVLNNMIEQKITNIPLVDDDGNYVCTCNIFDLIKFSNMEELDNLSIFKKYLNINLISYYEEVKLMHFESTEILYVCDNSGKLTGEISKDTFFIHYINGLKENYDVLMKLFEEEKTINWDILESMHDGIYLTDGNGYTLYVNEAYSKISGIKKEQLIGKHASQLMSEGIHLNSASLQVITEKKTISIIDYYKYGRQNRTEGKQCLLTANPVFDKKGDVIRVIINVRDLSELLELQRKLEQIEILNNKYSDELEKLRKEQLKRPKIVANSDCMIEIMETIDSIKDTDSVVLIYGETGVGKEVIVKELHNRSLRCSGPFIKVNCGAIPETLFESELFGYERGAFSGASNKGKPGMFELADGGTIFLDEIEDLPLSVQPKLLRILQEGELYRVGGVVSKKINARVISATNRDLKYMVKQGKFREDLFYRLNVVPIYIPPLRDRKKDIIPLLKHYLIVFNRKYDKNKIISKNSIDLLYSYEWPGNIRELCNFVERIVVTCKENIIEEERVYDILGKKTDNITENYKYYDNITLSEAISNLEKDLLRKSLEKNITTRKVAVSLGISQPSVVRKCHKYNIKIKK